MTKNSLTLALFILASVACKEKSTETVPNQINETITEKKEPPQILLDNQTKPVLFKYTSTGCPGCGSWGAPTFEKIAQENKQTSVPIAVHIKYGDPMITTISQEIADNRSGQRYTPQLFVNTKNAMELNGGRINGAKTIATVDSLFEFERQSETPIAVGVSSVINDTMIRIRYKTEALKNLEGEYKIAVYVMENKLLYQQSNATFNPYEHNYVIRTGLNGAFGIDIEKQFLVDGAVQEQIIDIKLDEKWKTQNLSATVIVWEKEGDFYKVINANNED